MCARQRREPGGYALRIMAAHPCEINAAACLGRGHAAPGGVLRRPICVPERPAWVPWRPVWVPWRPAWVPWRHRGGPFGCPGGQLGCPGGPFGCLGARLGAVQVHLGAREARLGGVEAQFGAPGGRWRFVLLRAPKTIKTVKLVDGKERKFQCGRNFSLTLKCRITFHLQGCAAIMRKNAVGVHVGAEKTLIVPLKRRQKVNVTQRALGDTSKTSRLSFLCGFRGRMVPKCNMLPHALLKRGVFSPVRAAAQRARG